MRISDWSSDVCSSGLVAQAGVDVAAAVIVARHVDQRRFPGHLLRPVLQQSAPQPGDDVRAAHQHRGAARAEQPGERARRSEEHTSELQSLMRISYAVFCLKKKTKKHIKTNMNNNNREQTGEQKRETN